MHHKRLFLINCNVTEFFFVCECLFKMVVNATLIILNNEYSVLNLNNILKFMIIQVYLRVFEHGQTDDIQFKVINIFQLC